MNNSLNLSTLALVAMMSIFSLTACSQKPSSEEIAAQVKIAMEQAEKEKQEAVLQAATPPQEAAAPVAAPVEAPARKPIRKQAAPKPPVVKPMAVVQEQEPPPPPVKSAKPVCENCGVVVAVYVNEEEGKGSGVGVIAGGVVGGLLGNQVGQGTGRDLATIAGAVGGAVAGNKIEKKSKKTLSYDIVVKMDNGEERTYSQDTDPGLAQGEKIKIENEVVVKVNP